MSMGTGPGTPAAALLDADCMEFQRDFLRAATDGRLELLRADVEPEDGRMVADVEVGSSAQYAEARQAIRDAGELTEMPIDRITDLLLAAGEAISNAMRHAGGGRCRVYVRAETVVVRVMDHGPGIPSANLPAVVLLPGFSTRLSLGLGYDMMLKLVDCVRLRTGPDGTLVQLEKAIHPDPTRNCAPPQPEALPA